MHSICRQVLHGLLILIHYTQKDLPVCFWWNVSRLSRLSPTRIISYAGSWLEGLYFGHWSRLLVPHLFYLFIEQNLRSYKMTVHEYSTQLLTIYVCTDSHLLEKQMTKTGRGEPKPIVNISRHTA